MPDEYLGSLMTRRGMLRRVAGAGSLVAAPSIVDAGPQELVVTMYGGAVEAGWRRNVVEPFER